MAVGESVDDVKIVRLRLGEPFAGSIYNGLWRQQAALRNHRLRVPAN